MVDRDKLSLALSVLAGTIEASDLDMGDYDKLGYNSYNFGYYGKPDEYEIRQNAKQIVMDAFDYLLNKEEQQ